MKSITKIILFTIFATIFAQAEPQQNTSKLGLGAHLGFGYGMIWGLDDDWAGGESKDNPGGFDFEIGAIGSYKISNLLQFTPELLFRYAKLSQDIGLGDYSFTQMDIQIPLFLRANATDKFFGFFGPQIGFNVSNDVEMKASDDTWNVNKVVSLSQDVEQAVFNFGISAGIGYYIVQKLSVDFRVLFGITELYPDAKGMVSLADAKIMSFKIGVSYWFI